MTGLTLSLLRVTLFRRLVSVSYGIETAEKNPRWLKAGKYLDDKFVIKVNFSDSHNTYYSAYKYVTKEDEEPYHSQGHPDLGDEPKTEKAIEKSKRKVNERRSNTGAKRRRKDRLSIYDVMELIQSKSIKSRLELVCLAVTQLLEGNKFIAEVARQSTKLFPVQKNSLRRRKNYIG